MTSRRALLRAIAAGALTLPRIASTQTEGRQYRVGWISVSNSFDEPYGVAFVRRLAELGFVERRNLVIERLHADNRLEQLPGLVTQLGKLKCDAYFGGGNEANLAALVQADPRTPIVFVAVDFDPVTTGDVANLARPGGRVTGVTALQSTLPAKRLELLKEALPAMRRVAVFTNEQTTAQLALVQGTARRLGLPIHVVDFKRPPFDYDARFAEATRAGADALYVLGSGLWISARRLIPELALKAGLPSIFHQSQWADAGGLISYGFNFLTMWRRGADMVAAVLRGAKAGEIPMEQPTDYELVFNLKTARALRVTIPQSLLVRADRLIEA
ncbi:MAG TPA: ABC transporter substrate-binding protein [Casimicrobiaceae bacterium]|jgi:putative ABC transport system substrate-binding protein